MDISFRNRVAFKQARTVLLISLLLGLISATLQINFDLAQERQVTQQEIDNYLTLYRETATRAVYNLNEPLASSITETLINHPTIYAAALVDDFGDPLSRSTRPRAPTHPLIGKISSRLFQLNSQYIINLSVDNAQAGTAKLVIELDTGYLAAQFTRRAITGLALGLLYNILLAMVFLLLFYHYLSKPIMDIAAWVKQLGDGPSTLPRPYTETDEIGDLVSSFEQLWQDRQAMTRQLNTTINELSRSENFARSLMQNAGDAMFLCQPDASIIEVNNQALDTLACEKSALVSHCLSAFSQEYSKDQLTKLFAKITSSQPDTFEDVQIAADGRRFPVEARGIRLHLEEQDYILILARDITVRKMAEERIHELAFFDSLTGLANRRLFIDRLSAALELHHVHQRFGAVFYMDLDRFKTINDSLGHSIGDELLQIIARRLKSLLPDEATCARFGGDEFVILLPETGSDAESSAEAVTHLANRILDQMSVPIEIDHHLLYCTTSVGIAVFPNPNCSAMDILRHADTALYRAKALGRNGFQFFNPEMQSAAQERMAVEKGLYQALENDEFELWYQPQIQGNHKVIGVEALLRWRSPEKGLIQPGEFIQVAEDSGQIVEIGFWVLNSALAQLAQWRRAGLPDSFRHMAINISPLQFMQVDFVDRLFSLLDQHQLPGNLVELEITENMLLNNFDIASRKMRIMKRRGISFAIDDFGTGYSSLKYLRHLPLDILKIDRSFVNGLKPHSEAEAIIEVIIATADRLDMVVIAEGVETETEQTILQKLGCHCFQGFLFHKPLPVTDAGALLQSQPAPQR